MMALVILYKWTILAGCLAAPVLSYLGGQLATRDRAMQTLCVGQGAMVGVLMGLGIMSYFPIPGGHTFGPLFSALLLSAGTYLATDHLVRSRAASKNTFFAFVFALLLAAGHLIGSLFPALESHMAQIYFGDLATLNTKDSQLMASVSALCGAILYGLRSSISNQSFESAVFGSLVSSRGGSASFVFRAVSLIMLSLSVQFVGFLFTVAMLFLPTALMNCLVRKGLRIHFVLCLCLTIVSTLTGFLLSLQFTRLPTVPTIVVVMFAFAVALLGAERLVLKLQLGGRNELESLDDGSGLAPVLER